MIINNATSVYTNLKLKLRPIPFRVWLWQIIYFVLLLAKVKTLSFVATLVSYSPRSETLKGIGRSLGLKRERFYYTVPFSWNTIVFFAESVTAHPLACTAYLITTILETGRYPRTSIAV